ncbi:hypothetical protein EU800_22910 [Tropicimonas sp. IMCC6043]|nr:hypothetical protein EU800_22910 [Tropicimonas sp. IMCC6043]
MEPGASVAEVARQHGLNAYMVFQWRGDPRFGEFERPVESQEPVTGFGLSGHLLEMVRGSECSARLDWVQVSFLAEARALAEDGHITGASGRNWMSYGAEVVLADGFSEVERGLLTDPQTSGGLLVSCAPEAQDDVLALFAAHGFADACVIGEVL